MKPLSRIARILCPAAMVWTAMLGVAPAAAELPDPDLGKLEPAVQEQLTQLRTLALTVVDNRLVPDADRAKAWGEMGSVYHAYDLVDAGEACYEQAELLAPDEPRWPYYRAHLAIARGDLDAAARLLLRVLQLDPLHFAAMVHAADVAVEVDRPEVAESLLKTALGVAPAAPVALARLGELALAGEQYDAAIELLSAALEAVPAATRLHHPLGLAYRGKGDLEAARRHLELRGEVGLAPPDPLMDELRTLRVGERVHLLQGRKAFQAGDYQAAVTEFGKAVAAKPDSARARVNLSAALAAAGDADGARSELQQAVALEPHNATARYNLGALLAASGEHLLAARHFAAALEQNNKDEESWLAEARAWIALGDFGRASERLSAANATLPTSGRIAYALARVLAAAPDLSARDGSRALQLAQMVFEAQPNVEHGILVVLALREAGECAQAEDWMADLIVQGEQHATSEEQRRMRDALASFAGSVPCRP